MSIDIRRVVGSVRDDLKRAYAQSPGAVWAKPFVVIAQRGGETGYLDQSSPEVDTVAWIARFRREKNIDAVVVGRMVIKASDVLGADGKPIIKEKAILVTGRDFNNGRTVVSITPTKEHRDYRSVESIDKGPKLFKPGLTSPDVVKPIKDENEKTVGWLEGQFGKEELYDSREGKRCVMDPLIAGVLSAPVPGGGV